MHPIENMRRAATNDAARGRIGPHFVNLTPEAEIAERRPPAKQIGPTCEMAVQ